MSVSSKYIHKSFNVYISSVSVSWSRFLAFNYTEFRLLNYSSNRLIKRCIVPMFSLFHWMIVLIKAFISILDYERVKHGYRSGWGQTLWFFFLLWFSTILITLGSVLLGRWTMIDTHLFSGALIQSSASSIWRITVIVL